eukprot:gene4902-6863_t
MSTSMSLSDTSHCFERDHTSDVCSICYGVWPSADGIVSKYYNCVTCGFKVHSGCRNLTSNLSIECQPSLILEKPKLSSGELFIKLKQIYDINCSSGTILYGVFRFTFSGEYFRTSTSISNERECTWIHSNAINDKLNPLNMVNSLVIDNHMIETKDNGSNPFLLEIEVWKNYMMGVFDSALCTCEIDISPALHYPHKTIERWFAINNLTTTDTEQDNISKVLVEFLFIPHNTSKIIADENSSLPKIAKIKSNDLIVESIYPSTDNNTDVDSEKILQEMLENYTNSLKEELSVQHNSSILSSDLSIVSDIIHPHTTHEIENVTTGGITSTNVDIIMLNDRQVGQSHFDDYSNNYNNNYNENSNNNIDNNNNNNNNNNNSYERHDLIIKLNKSTDESVYSNSTNPLTSPITPDLMMQSISNFGEQTVAYVSNFFYELEQPDKEESRTFPNHENINSDPLISQSSSNNINISYSNTIILDPYHLKSNYIGIIHLHIISAFKYDVKRIDDGDHYISIHLTDDSNPVDLITSKPFLFHTSKIYASATPIFNSKFSFKAKHFRNKIIMYLMDANSNRKVGQASFSIYQIIQRDCDEETYSKWDNKNSENIIFYDINDDTKELGYFSLKRLFEENQNLFTSQCDKIVTASETPPENLSVERLALHIARFSSIIDLFTLWYTEYENIMNWKDFFLTSLPKEIPITYKPVSVLKISVLGFKTNNNNSLQKKPIVKVSFYPMIDKNSNNSNNNDTSSTSNGSTGLNFDNFKKINRNKNQISETVTQLMTNIVKTTTNNSNTNNNSNKNNAVSDFEFNVDKHLIYNINEPWPLNKSNNGNNNNNNNNNSLIDYIINERNMKTEYSEICLLYPIIQPLTSSLKLSTQDYNYIFSNEKSSNQSNLLKKLKSSEFWPWKYNKGIILLTLQYDSSASFIDSYSEEFVQIRLCDLVNNTSYSEGIVGKDSSTLESYDSQNEVIKWFTATKTMNGYALSDPTVSDGTITGSNHDNSMNGDQTQVLVRLQLELKSKKSSLHPSIDEIETSIHIQNLMNWLLDLIESFKNILNWTNPSKTFPIYMAVIAVWLITIIIPGRIIILIIGLYQFFFILLPVPETPIAMIRFYNYLQSIPNDDDLDHIYQKDKISFIQTKKQARFDLIQRNKDKLVLKTKWKSNNCYIKLNGNNNNNANNSNNNNNNNNNNANNNNNNNNNNFSSNSNHNYSNYGVLESININNNHDESRSNSILSNDWQLVFILLQGRRLVWWGCEEDYDKGYEALGQLLLFGHTGYTEASITDKLQIIQADHHLLVAIFGMDIFNVPQKITMLCQNDKNKEDLIRSIEELVDK